MATVNLSAIAGDNTPFVMKAEDLGSGSASSVSGKILVPHSHDEIWKAAWDSLYNIGLTKLFLSGTEDTSGSTSLVTAPGAGNKISIAYVVLANESTTETTVTLLSASTEIYRALLTPKGDAGSVREISFPVHHPLECGTNEALSINLSGANAIGYSIGYVVKAA
jgi:hypothetical protein